MKSKFRGGSYRSLGRVAAFFSLVLVICVLAETSALAEDRIPAADFTWAPTSPVLNQSVQFTDTSTGSPTSWSWILGDGSTSTSQNPTHTYLTAGTYSVFLQVANSSGTSTKSRQFTVGVGSCTADFSWIPSSPLQLQQVQFTDKSMCSPAATSFWVWSFGDGSTSMLQNPTHAYSTAGTYLVSLTVTNTSGGSNTARQSITVSTATVAPAANFSWTPTSPMTNQLVQFTDTSTGSPTSWAWDFGDGVTANAPNPTHMYSSGGTYSVSLSVTNSAGSNTATQSITVSSATAAPVANFNWAPTSPTTSQLVQFTDTSTGSPTSWSWNFGDGTYAHAQNPGHIYPSAGSYSVSLSVTNAGGSNTATQSITVSTVMQAPTVTSISPVSAVQATTLSGFIVNGSNFDSSSILSFSGAGITVDSYTSIQKDKIVANISIDGSAEIGRRDVIVTSNGQEGLLPSAFEVKPAGSTTTYRYTGQPYNPNPPTFCNGTYIVICRQLAVTGFFTTAGPLDPNLNAYTFTPASFSFSDGSGVFTLTSAQNLAISTFSVSTDATGKIIAWSINLATTAAGCNLTVISGVCLGSYYNGTTNRQAGDFSAYEYNAGTPSQVFGAGQNSNTPGTWSTENQTTLSPAANFTWTPASPNANQFVQFTDTSTGSPTSWFWNFGDGGTSTAQNPTHTYTTAATYSVFLTAANASGSSSKTAQIVVGTASVISTIGGTGIPGFSGDGGAAIAAQLMLPQAMAIDAAGNLFIADQGNSRIRKITPLGIISTVAGTGTSGFTGDNGPATSAQISNPRGIAIDAAGNLFIADSSNYRVRKVTPAGIISTVAGNGISGSIGDGGLAVFAQLTYPEGLAVDATGNLYIGDSRGYRVRKVTPMGIILTVAGDGTAGLSGDGGPATSAQLNNPSAVAVDGMGNLFIGDYYNHSVRKVTPDGTISTIAGNGSTGFSGDGGPATSAQLSYPGGVATDLAGNVFIADRDNQRVRKVTLNGIILTVAGNGSAGFSGDGSAATSAQLHNPGGVMVDVAGNLFIADTENHRVRKVSSWTQSGGTSYAITDRGEISLITSGNSSDIQIGFGRIHTASGTAPSGVAVFEYRHNGILVSETDIPASLPLVSGRIYAEIDGAVNTGIAIANPNNSATTINFLFTDTIGNDLGAGSMIIAANSQAAQFLSQAPYNLAAFRGTFSFTSSLPVAVVALRSLLNQRGESLMSTLPVIDTTAPVGSAIQVLPQYADGEGWTTQILLVNPTNAALTGNVQFFNDSGTPSNVTIAGQTASGFAYYLAPRSSQKLVTSGTSAAVAAGSVHVVPTVGTPTPVPLGLFSYRASGFVVSEAGVPVVAGTALRIPVEYAGTSGQPGALLSGVAVANNSPASVSVTFEVTQLDGTAVNGLTPVSINLVGLGQVAKFLSDIFPSLPNPFRGVLRISTSSGISVVGLRFRVNERNDLLLTTIPPSVEDAPPTVADMFFPHFIDGGGYTTQFVLFSGKAGQSASGTLIFYDQHGEPLNLTLRPGGSAPYR